MNDNNFSMIALSDMKSVESKHRGVSGHEWKQGMLISYGVKIKLEVLLCVYSCAAQMHNNTLCQHTFHPPPWTTYGNAEAPPPLPPPS